MKLHEILTKGQEASFDGPNVHISVGEEEEGHYVSIYRVDGNYTDVIHHQEMGDAIEFAEALAKVLVPNVSSREDQWEVAAKGIEGETDE